MDREKKGGNEWEVESELGHKAVWRARCTRDGEIKEGG